MKWLMRCCSVVMLILLTAIQAKAELRQMTSLPKEAQEIVDKEISSRFPGATIKQMMLTSQFSDAGIYDLPESDWDGIHLYDDNVDLAKANELGLLFAFTSSKRFDLKFTHGSKKMDDLYQYLLRRARGDASVRGLSKTVLADRTLPNYIRAVLWVKIDIPKGGFNPVRRDIIYRPEQADSMAALREALNRRVGLIEKDVEMLKRRPIGGGLQANDMGLSGFAGGETFSVAKQTYNGAVLGFDYRYLDFALEGFIGELGNDSQQLTQIGTDLIPRFSNNHVEGGSIYWAPMQDDRWGKRWKIGATGFHGQHDNIANVSNQELYYAGAAGTLAWPLPIVTPEVWATVGYGWTRTASYDYTVAPNKGEGVGYGARLTLVVGRR